MNPDCQEAGWRDSLPTSCKWKQKYAERFAGSNCSIVLFHWGKSLWACMCTECRESTWHFISRTDCVLPSGCCLAPRQNSFFFSPCLLQTNQSEKSDHNQERFTELIKKMNRLKKVFFKSQKWWSSWERKWSEIVMPADHTFIIFLLYGKQFSWISLGISLNPAQEMGNVLITPNNPHENGTLAATQEVYKIQQ